MFRYDFEEHSTEIQSFMIAANHQGKGYGEQAIQKAIDFLKAEGKTKIIHLDYAEENVVAKHIYKKVGFTFVCKDDYGEIMMKLLL